MKSNNVLILFFILAAAVGCGKSSNSGGNTSTGSVSTATLVSIAVTPTNPSIIQGSTLQFTATGTFSDNTTTILSSVVTWSSSSQSVATISTTGLATSVATGSALITALSGTFSNSTTLTVSAPTAPALNVIPITVNGSLCSAATSANYVNKPCISVTVCTAGTSTCQTVSDILLDTGSYGLRIFKSVLTGVSPVQVPSGTGSLAECVQFADGSSHWGPVMTADVILGQEPAVTVPIQVIDATFGVVPTGANGCGSPSLNPSAAGYNGILGVGFFAEDCGPFCASQAINGSYYTCSGLSCTGTKVALSSQVPNPVARLPLDNNGLIMQLPSVAAGGATSINGSLVLGIGTRSNNAPSGVTMYPADPNGLFTTVFNGTTYSQSFIDSGSNALYFSAPASLLPVCAGINAGWYCPASTTTLSATNKGYTGAPSNPVQFAIGNTNSLFNSPSNMVFGELGGTMSGLSQSFDWGLPFYFGRNVYLGIENTRSSLGTGPYWAY